MSEDKFQLLDQLLALTSFFLMVVHTGEEMIILTCSQRLSEDKERATPE